MWWSWITITGGVQNTSGTILINGASEVHIAYSYNTCGNALVASVDVSTTDGSEILKLSIDYQTPGTCDIILPNTILTFNSLQNEYNQVKLPGQQHQN